MMLLGFTPALHASRVNRFIVSVCYAEAIICCEECATLRQMSTCLFCDQVLLYSSILKSHYADA